MHLLMDLYPHHNERYTEKRAAVATFSYPRELLGVALNHLTLKEARLTNSLFLRPAQNTNMMKCQHPQVPFSLVLWFFSKACGWGNSQWP